MIRLSSCHKSGFVAMIALILLILFGSLGASYWLTSRLSTDMIVTEAHRIKARNFAQAAVEKVKINIANQYSANNYDMSFPNKYSSDRTSKEYKMEFGDGRYEVVSVKPYEDGSRSYNSVPHHKNGIKIGYYDIWEVIVLGEVSSSAVKAHKRSLIKVYRSFVHY